MLKPINIRIGDFHVFSLNGHGIENYEALAEAVLSILSDEQTLRFIPEKRLRNIKEAQRWIYTSILNFHSGRNYVQMIASRKSGKIMGMIDILSPALVREHYQLGAYPYFLEFYLKSEVQGLNIMSALLPKMFELLENMNIETLAAVADRSNLAARRVLSKSGFINRGVFDITKDINYTAIGQDFNTGHKMIAQR